LKKRRIFRHLKKVMENSKTQNKSDSESDKGNSSSGNYTIINNSAPGFGLFGGLTCLYGGWKLRKK